MQGNCRWVATYATANERQPERGWGRADNIANERALLLADGSRRRPMRRSFGAPKRLPQCSLSPQLPSPNAIPLGDWRGRGGAGECEGRGEREEQ